MLQIAVRVRDLFRLMPTFVVEMAAASREELESSNNLPPSNWSRGMPRPKPSPLRTSRIPSVGELAEKKEEKWTVYSGSQNLPTALNDPSNRELDLFTRTWGSYFIPTASLPPSSFPTIEVTDFLRYLKETSAGRKIHRALVRQLSREENEACWSPSSPGEFPPLISQLQQDGKNYDVACVPRIFMQKDFSLEDPPTFLEVLPLTQLLPKKKHNPKTQPQATADQPDQRPSKVVQQTKKDVTTDRGTAEPYSGGSDAGNRHQSLKLLHEKLTHYLDVIEVHLAYQISQRSDIFFSTLSSQQELQLHIMQVRQEVMELRHKLRQVSATCVCGSLQLFNKCRRLQRFKVLFEKLKLISTVQQTQPTIQLLLRNSDFVGALDLITTTQEVLQQELHGVHALRHLGSQLAEMENVIEKMMESDLVEYAMQDIRRRLEMCRDTAQVETESEERLGMVVLGLLRQGKFHFMAALRQSLLSFLKAKVKGVVSGYLQGEGFAEENSSLAECMRGMEFHAWLAMLTEVLARMLQCQSAVQGCVGVIAGVCAGAGGLVSSTVDSSSVTSTPTVSGPVTPSVGTPGLPSPSLALLATENTDQQGERSELLEQFEASAMAQEAEDRLAQLMMDEELSDARLAGVDGDMELLGGLEGEERRQVDEGVLGGMGGQEQFNGDKSGISDSKLERSIRRYVEDTEATFGQDGVLPRPSRMDLNWMPEPSVPTEVELSRTADETMCTTYEPTQDPEEYERLDPSRSVSSIPKCPSAFLSAVESQRLLVECHSLISASCLLVHARCAKILDVRARAGLLRDLLPTDFLSLVHCVEDFVRQSGVITGIHCPNLRIALQSQAKNFLEKFHENSRKKISLLLEGERWKQADVPAEIQCLVNKLEAGVLISAGSELPPPSLPPTKFLLIHGNNYAVVGTVLLLVKVLVEYCHYADSLPVLINEVMTKLIDLIKFFNTRTCELVLGAGAMNAVGLKAITARHLGIMMRCLQAISVLIPDLRKHFELRLEKQQHVLLMQFDVVTMDFSRHCSQINSKFMSIMGDVIQKNLAKWEVKQPIPSPAFRTITRQLVKLHENLVDILPPQLLEALFANIEVTFRSRLKEQLLKLNITNNGSTKHGIVNSELHHCEGALSSLDYISAFGSSLFDVWSSAT